MTDVTVDYCRPEDNTVTIEVKHLGVDLTIDVPPGATTLEFWMAMLQAYRVAGYGNEVHITLPGYGDGDVNKAVGYSNATGIYVDVSEAEPVIDEDRLEFNFDDQADEDRYSFDYEREDYCAAE